MIISKYINWVDFWYSELEHFINEMSEELDDISYNVIIRFHMGGNTLEIDSDKCFIDIDTKHIIIYFSEVGEPYNHPEWYKIYKFIFNYPSCGDDPVLISAEYSETL